MQQREKQHGHFQPERLRPCRVHRTGQGCITTRDARREQIAWVRCGAAGLPRTAPDPSREREQVITPGTADKTRAVPNERGQSEIEVTGIACDGAVRCNRSPQRLNVAANWRLPVRSSR